MADEVQWWVYALYLWDANEGGDDPVVVEVHRTRSGAQVGMRKFVRDWTGHLETTIDDQGTEVRYTHSNGSFVEVQPIRLLD